MATATVVAMAMVATVVDTVDTAEATMARGMLMPLLRLPLRLPLMPSLVMAMAMAVATDMAAMDTDVSMVDMEDTDTARGALRLMLSPDMDTTAVAMEAMATDVSMEAMAMVADTTDNFLSNSSFLYSNIHSCSKIESCFTSKFLEIKVSNIIYVSVNY